ncbi:MAG: hypothetical protein NC040_05750 [Muribaculaceae bacterium]|nr:hypothetical protein [Alistipes senegalensis]MCM1473539.1 hypothetical protein [Muribaculaceae bacterium]
MYELTDDIFYEYIKKYDELSLDYVILSDDGEYYGETSHKKAVINAISVINSRKRIGNQYYKKSPEFYVDENKMICRKCSNENFFEITPKKIGYTEISYCDAFLYCTPYRIYSGKEFEKINHVLFPEYFRKNLEIYQWNDDFSDYFNDGKECFGAAMWSIYDKNMCRFIIIGTSVTD